MMGNSTPMGQRQIAVGMNRLPLVNGGRAVETFQTGQTYYNGQVDTDLGELRGVREGLGVRSTIHIPLHVGVERRGVIQVDSMHQDAFSHKDVVFLRAAAHWMGLVVQRSELVEQVTQEAVEEAQRRSAQEIITILAHDLRNYLNPLLNRSFLLQERAVREERTRDAEQLTLLTTGIQRLARLIQDLLDINRLQQGIFRLNLVPTNIVTLAYDTANLLQTKDALIRVTAPVEAIAEIDPDRIRQALENLLVNAQRYTPAGVPVELTIQESLRDNAQWILIDVHNVGLPISPLFLPHLFQRFRAGSESRGLGLGLYLVHEIVRAHGGSITVESQQGKGTTFTVALPAPGPPVST